MTIAARSEFFAVLQFEPRLKRSLSSLSLEKFTPQNLPDGQYILPESLAIIIAKPRGHPKSEKKLKVILEFPWPDSWPR